MNTSMSRISYTDALPELVPGGWGRTRPWTHPHLPPTGRPAPAPPSRLQQLLRSLQTVDRYQISSVSSVYIEQLLYLVRGHLLGPARLPQPDCLVPDMYAMFDIVINRLINILSQPTIWAACPLSNGMWSLSLKILWPKSQNFLSLHSEHRQTPLTCLPGPAAWWGRPGRCWGRAWWRGRGRGGGRVMFWAGPGPDCGLVTQSIVTSRYIYCNMVTKYSS